MITSRAATFLLLTLALAAGSAACRKDEGPGKVSEAKAKYEQLVLAHKPATDPGFDEVLKTLEAVPADSKAHPEAVRLRDAIQAARGPRPGRPLAPTDLRRDEPEVKAKQDACARLARELGTVAESEREAKKSELEKCRVELEKLIAHDKHAPGEGH
jgi:hypothetical protein